MYNKINGLVAELHRGSKTESKKPLLTPTPGIRQNMFTRTFQCTICNGCCNTCCFILSSVYDEINCKNGID